jgi:hypothetical protein
MTGRLYPRKPCYTTYIVVICGNRYWVCKSYVCQSKSSLEFYTGHTTPFTERVDRWLSVATPMQKAAEIPLEVLHRTVSVVVLPHLDELEKVNARLIDFSCVVKSVVIYLTFCCFVDSK